MDILFFSVEPGMLAVSLEEPVSTSSGVSVRNTGKRLRNNAVFSMGLSTDVSTI